MTTSLIGYRRALETLLACLAPLPCRDVPLPQSEGCVAAGNVHAVVDAPSVHSSTKDGYALRAADVSGATEDGPVDLRITGVAAAGADSADAVEAGTAIRILTGAPIPPGADTVVAEEFAQAAEGLVTITEPAVVGRNILSRGSDITKGDTLVETGDQLTPGRIGLLAAGGHAMVPVVSRPHVALIATGDEVVLPGQDLSAGKLYASNLLTLDGWCQRFGFQTSLDIVKDDAEALEVQFSQAARGYDAIVTSGGAWTGDKDLMARVLDKLGWEKQFHRVRLGPGKAAGFGRLSGTPVFLLPGGPPSNLVAFLTLALPGLMMLAGYPEQGLPRISARLEFTVTGQIDWTQAIFGRFLSDENGLVFSPDSRRGSRLQSMARAQGLLLIPEGVTRMDEGDVVEVLLLA